MSNSITPLFATHHSISESILTAENEEEIKSNAPVSVIAIAKSHEERAITVVESDISSFWKLYEGTNALGIELRYGVKLTVCSKMFRHDDEDVKKTESNVIVFFKNSKAYYDFIPIYSTASVEGMEGGRRRVDWEYLNRHWTDNFVLAMPFYSSFVARNLMKLGNKAYPDFHSIGKPVFFIEKHGLPFDSLISQGVARYASSQGYPVHETHQVYYYRDEDFIKHQTLKCISKRTTLQKPNLEHYGSNQFSYESYLKRIGKSL